MNYTFQSSFKFEKIGANYDVAKEIFSTTSFTASICVRTVILAALLLLSNGTRPHGLVPLDGIRLTLKGVIVSKFAF